MIGILSYGFLQFNLVDVIKYLNISGYGINYAYYITTAVVLCAHLFCFFPEGFGNVLYMHWMWYWLGVAGMVDWL